MPSFITTRWYPSRVSLPSQCMPSQYPPLSISQFIFLYITCTVCIVFVNGRCFVLKTSCHVCLVVPTLGMRCSNQGTLLYLCLLHLLLSTCVDYFTCRQKQRVLVPQFAAVFIFPVALIRECWVGCMSRLFSVTHVVHRRLGNTLSSTHDAF